MRSIYYLEVNIICFIVLFILYCGMLRAGKNIRDKLYRILLLTGIALCTSDALAGVLRGTLYPYSKIILWISNIVYFESAFVMTGVWIAYSMYVLFGKIDIKIIIVSSCILIAGFLFFLSAPLNGLAFTISDDNLYSRGPFVFFQHLIVVPGMLFPSITAFFSKSPKRERHTIMSFIIFPAIAIVIQFFSYGVTVCQVGTTISSLIVYILYQSRIVDEAVSKAELLDEISNTDAMTNLKNRRAYEIKISELESADWVGTAFADLNGLKRTNDTKGHKAGDVMICNFADFLKDYFEPNEIFRISGDEFVILSTAKNVFEEQYKKMISLVGDIASVGKCEGTGHDVVSIIRDAEKDMYKNKSNYYIRTGINRRK